MRSLAAEDYPYHGAGKCTDDTAHYIRQIRHSERAEECTEQFALESHGMEGKRKHKRIFFALGIIFFQLLMAFYHRIDIVFSDSADKIRNGEIEHRADYGYRYGIL